MFSQFLTSTESESTENNELSICRKMPTIDDLNGEQKLILEAFHSEYPTAKVEELWGFLKYREYSMPQAMVQYASYLNFREKTEPPKINQIAPFLRNPIDGGIFLLERKGVDCCRDRQGRPIIACIGILHGSVYEMQLQMTYALSRAQLYGCPNKLQCHCSVIEVVPRSGSIATFRY